MIRVTAITEQAAITSPGDRIRGLRIPVQLSG